MNHSASNTLRSREQTEPMTLEPERTNGEDRTAQPDDSSTLGQGKQRRATTGRRGWFGGDESQSIAFYGEYYR
ncbi:hypothetical protein Poly30_06690 [Planctomycetes bacterium Poly30]|uniref:Uncharacterized protein n=1 Tax=Saltatorellus ferox TaxID=2528018 RepID=A0A518EM72_9BACT|nr:hypothetical protein Poly30_06690 [Planctomycetes bacterium Poly30]